MTRWKFLTYEDTTGVESLSMDSENDRSTIIRRYNLSGISVNKDYKEIVIEVYSNGKVRKVVQK